jgi:predicted nucleic acid-binding protein
MITAIDSSVLIDLLVGHDRFAERSEIALRKSAEAGSLVVCETGLAEFSPTVTSGKLVEFLEDCSIRFLASSLESSLLAGETFKAHLKRGGKRGRVLADFMIAAHAYVHADRLLTRDRGYYRDYFKKLKVLEP